MLRSEETDFHVPFQGRLLKTVPILHSKKTYLKRSFNFTQLLYLL